MKIEFNEQKILSEILERDGELHIKIKQKVEQKLIDTLVERIENKYLDKRWSGERDIADNVIEGLEEKQTEIVRDILRKFYNSYRYEKADLAILKKLKVLLGESD